jgi:PadR family transcriptional regulator PadR
VCVDKDRECCCLPLGMAPLLRPWLLLLLACESPAHGYDLAERLRAYAARGDLPDPTTVYRALRQMEAEGLVSSEWDSRESGPAKRVYVITSQGLDILAALETAVGERKKSLTKFLRLLRECKCCKTDRPRRGRPRERR